MTEKENWTTQDLITVDEQKKERKTLLIMSLVAASIAAVIAFGVSAIVFD
ncbi:hypothetical protein [Risungbinella massiliensis]|nr:hypothetical protein [Risungbinella massiliensis]